MRNWLTSRTGCALAVGLLLATFALRLIDSANRNALTIDEPHYIGKGLYLWDTHDYDYAASLNFHPPLTYHLASLPLLFLDVDDVPRTTDIGHRLLAGTDPDPVRVRLLSRLPFIALACWGALLMFLWATELAGPVAGVLAVALFTASPVVLAGSFLAHSDITVAVFFVQTFYTLWRWLERPGPLRLVLCGLSLGLALVAKLNALVLLTTVGLLLLAREFQVWPLAFDGPGESRRRSPADLVRCLVRASGALAIFLGLSTLVVWVAYGFSFASVQLSGGLFDGFWLPGYLHAFVFDLVANAQSRSIYLLGEIGEDGKFWYLPLVAWVLKTPIAFFVLLGLALGSRSSEQPAPIHRVNRFTLFCFGVYLAVALFCLRVPLGLRYLLPILPLLDLFVATRLGPLQGWRSVATCVLVAWMWAVGAWIHPHYLAYFNPLIGGPAHAHRALVESNYDWGQALPALAEELKRRGNPTVSLAYFGVEPADRYGIVSRPLTGCRPVTGHVAISATLLRGLYSVDNPFVNAPDGCYDWLLAREPVAQPGYAILLYDIPEPD